MKRFAGLVFCLIFCTVNSECQVPFDSLPKYHIGTRVVGYNVLGELFFEMRLKPKKYIGFAYFPFASRGDFLKGNSFSIYVNNEIIRNRKNRFFLNYGFNYQNYQQGDLNFNLTTESFEYFQNIGGQPSSFRNRIIFFGAMEYERLVSKHFSWSFSTVYSVTRYALLQLNNNGLSVFFYPSIAIRYKFNPYKRKKNDEENEDL